MYHFHVARNVCVAELRYVRKAFLAVVVLVALDVGLVFEVDTVFIAEVVPVGCIGVVRVTHMVDVAALHQEHFFFHLFARNVVTRFGVCFMTVHTLHLDGLSVQVVVTSGQSEFVLVGRCVLDFDFAEAHNGREGFDGASLLVQQFAHQRIAVRSFGAPRLHGVAGIERKLCHNFVVLANGSHRSSLVQH